MEGHDDSWRGGCPVKLAGVLQAAIVAAVLLTLMARAACNKPATGIKDKSHPERRPVS